MCTVVHALLVHAALYMRMCTVAMPARACLGAAVVAHGTLHSGVCLQHYCAILSAQLVLRFALPRCADVHYDTVEPLEAPFKTKQNKTGRALTEPSLKCYLVPFLLPSPFPHPHTTQSGRAQRTLQSPSHKKPKALTFVSKDDGTLPLFCFASSGPLALLTRVLSSVQQVVL